MFRTRVALTGGRAGSVTEAVFLVSAVHTVVDTVAQGVDIQTVSAVHKRVVVWTAVVVGIRTLGYKGNEKLRIVRATVRTERKEYTSGVKEPEMIKA